MLTASTSWQRSDISSSTTKLKGARICMTPSSSAWFSRLISGSTRAWSRKIIRHWMNNTGCWSRQSTPRTQSSTTGSSRFRSWSLSWMRLAQFMRKRQEQSRTAASTTRRLRSCSLMSRSGRARDRRPESCQKRMQREAMKGSRSLICHTISTRSSKWASSRTRSGSRAPSWSKIARRGERTYSFSKVAIEASTWKTVTLTCRDSWSPSPPSLRPSWMPLLAYSLPTKASHPRYIFRTKSSTRSNTSAWPSPTQELAHVSSCKCSSSCDWCSSIQRIKKSHHSSPRSSSRNRVYKCCFMCAQLVWPLTWNRFA